MKRKLASWAAVRRRTEAALIRQRSTTAGRWGFVGAGILLALLPALRIAWRIPEVVHSSFGDNAIIELATIEAAAGQRLVGQPTRFGFFQPGPAHFYSLAPLYMVGGGDAPALALSSLLWNCVFLVTLGLLLARELEPGLVLPFTMALSVVFLAHAPAALLYSYWNAYAIVAPAMLLPMLATAACRYSIAWPALLALGSLLLQAYASPGPAVVTTIAVALGLFLRHLRSTGLSGRRRNLVTALVGSAGVLALLWGPPSYEEVVCHPGNLSAIVGAAATTPAAPVSTAGSASDAIARLIAAPVLHLLPSNGGDTLSQSRESQRSLIAAILLALGLLVAAGIAHRRRQPAAATLCIMLLIAGGSTAGTVTRIPGGPEPYALVWLEAVSAVGWGVAAGTLGSALLSFLFRHRQRVARREIWFVSWTAMLSLWLLLHPRELAPQGDKHLAKVTESVVGLARAQGWREGWPLHLVSHDLDQWWVSGIMARLHQRGIDVGARGLTAAGPYWEAHGEAVALHFATSAQAPARNLTRLACYEVTALRASSSGKSALCVFAPLRQPSGANLARVAGRRRSCRPQPVPLTDWRAAYSAPTRLIATPRSTIEIMVGVRNLGEESWAASGLINGCHAVRLISRTWTNSGELVELEGRRAPLPDDVPPGHDVQVAMEVRVPDQPGTYLVDVGLIQECVNWFDAMGSPPARITIVAEP